MADQISSQSKVPASKSKGPPDAQLSGFWSQAAPDLLTKLGATAQGLTTPEAAQRLKAYGPNSLQARQQASGLMLFLNQFKSPLVLILIFAAVISIFAQEWTDAAIVLIIIFGSSVLSFYQEYSATTAVKKLQEKVTIKSTVLRDGQPTAIPAETVVPGDVVLLSAGSLIPADGVVLAVQDFFVSQSVLTGETFPVEKTPGVAPARASMTERTNCVFMGTSVRSGTAQALIVQTGKATAYGQIAQHLALRPPETEFEHGVRHYGYLLTQIMLVMVLVVFIVDVVYKKPPIDSLLFAIALAVGMAPELLPAIISITLAKGAQEMSKRGVIVRRLNAIENFGSMDVLCTDKTGTLTQGVVRLDGALDFAGQPSPRVMRCAYLNAYFQSGIPNPLDEAVVNRAKEDGLVPEPDKKLYEIPYDFVRKRLSVVVKNEQGNLNLVTKGALDHVLEVCTRVEVGSDQADLDNQHRQQIQQRYADWSAQGFRVLGVAVRPIDSAARLTRNDEHDLVFVGFLIFLDPPKEGVKQTIQDLAKLGVQLKIITGDNRLVAAHIAEIVGLQVSGIITGDEMSAMHDEALWNLAEKTTLFVDVDPNEKERIILALRKMGHVVGYMGDGINDAPALHSADIGISVDNAVDVAKEAADLVLLKQDLDVLRRGIEQGRVTFANTIKYIFATTSANFGNMFSMAGASFFLPFLPLLAGQILLNNFLSDIPAMTIASDNLDNEQVVRPRRWDIKFLRNFMVVFGLVSSVFDFITFGVLLFILNATQEQFHTGWFIESLMTELFIVLVVRTRRSMFKSKPGRALLISSLVAAVVTVFIPYLPFSAVVGFVPLPFPMLAAMLLITLAYIAASEVTKYYFYRKLYP